VVRRRLGRSGLELSPIGFGAFKIGRNQGAKYVSGYAIPDDDAVATLLNGVIDLGINYIDTAPAYGSSEERIGRVIHDRRGEVIISTKVGETFANGRSTFDFSAAAVRDSVVRSRRRLGTSVLDLVFVHSSGKDLDVLDATDAVGTLCSLRDAGDIRAIGFSGKTVEGAAASLDWADAIMVQYHLDDRSHEEVIALAAKRGVGVIVKKGLASGRLEARPAIEFVLANPNVTSMVIGGLSLDHMRENFAAARST
jgi:aryl-alcohol dehydrogenase-like predicted oxidoreductase